MITTLWHQRQHPCLSGPSSACVQNQQIHRGCRIHRPPLSLNTPWNQLLHQKQFSWFQLSVQHNLTQEADWKTSPPLCWCVQHGAPQDFVLITLLFTLYTPSHQNCVKCADDTTRQQSSVILQTPLHPLHSTPPNSFFVFIVFCNEALRDSCFANLVL